MPKSPESEKEIVFSGRLAIRTIGGFISSVIIIYLFACIIFYYVNLKNLDSEFGEKLLSVAKISAEEVSSLNLDLLSHPPLSTALNRRIARKLEPIADAADLENISILNRDKITLFDLKNREMEGEKNPFVYAYSTEIEKAFRGILSYSTLYRGISGNLYKSAFVPIRDDGNEIRWILSVDANPEFLRLIDSILKWIAVSGAVSLCVTVFLSLIFATTVVRKIKKLDLVAKQISMGNFNVTVDSRGKDEIDHLASTFNEMVLSINDMKKFYEYILDSTLSGIITINFLGHLTSINPAAIDILELKKNQEHYLNKNVFQVLSGYGNIPDNLKKQMDEKSSADYFELSFKRLSGEDRYLGANVSLLKNESGETIGMTFSFLDISEIKKLEKKLALNARLAALGEMSAGIAHEIRNPLGSIQIYMDLLKKRISHRKDENEICDQVIEEVDTLNAFITEFLVYARPPRLELKNEDIYKIIDEVIIQLPLRNDNIEIIKSYDSREGMALKIDREQVKRAFLNIFLNSLEAIKDNGKIIIDTSLTEKNNVEFIEESKEAPGGMTKIFCISIRDTGTGIPRDKINKIFEPFFSTKESGTGLGLPISEKIIREHNGEIEVVSDNEGTTVFLYFNVE